ncbi:MAG: hypothetical protein LKE45_03000 [Olsenella sp.]|nr:hypothetical protein [Olsenella sp.]
MGLAEQPAWRQAPSTSALLDAALPALVMCPLAPLSPDECSEGISPHQLACSGAVGNLGRQPASAARQNALISSMPLMQGEGARSGPPVPACLFLRLLLKLALVGLGAPHAGQAVCEGLARRPANEDAGHEAVLELTPEGESTEQAKRGDVELVKAGEDDYSRLANVPFKITSKTTGESHVTFDGANLSGHAVVAFESLTLDGQEVASHADVNDEGQTVELVPPETPEVPTPGGELPQTGDELPIAGICALAAAGCAASVIGIARSISSHRRKEEVDDIIVNLDQAIFKA